MFTKSFLETGMIVEIKDGSRYVVIIPDNNIENGILMNDNEIYHLDEFDSNLMIKKRVFLPTYSWTVRRLVNMDQTEEDIVKVWKQNPKYDLKEVLSNTTVFLTQCGELIFDRDAEEVEEMTMDEVCQALGKNIKIVKEK